MEGVRQQATLSSYEEEHSDSASPGGSKPKHKKDILRRSKSSMLEAMNHSSDEKESLEKRLWQLREENQRNIQKLSSATDKHEFLTAQLEVETGLACREKDILDAENGALCTTLETLCAENSELKRSIASSTRNVQKYREQLKNFKSTLLNFRLKSSETLAFYLDQMHAVNHDVRLILKQQLKHTYDKELRGKLTSIIRFLQRDDETSKLFEQFEYMNDKWCAANICHHSLQNQLNDLKKINNVYDGKDPLLIESENPSTESVSIAESRDKNKLNDGTDLATISHTVSDSALPMTSKSKHAKAKNLLVGQSFSSCLLKDDQ